MDHICTAAPLLQMAHEITSQANNLLVMMFVVDTRTDSAIHYSSHQDFDPNQFLKMKM